MLTLTLTEEERFVVDATLRAEEASFKASSVDRLHADGSSEKIAKVVIRAGLIRSLMLGVPVIKWPGEDPKVIDIPGAGIRITYAQIEGELDLKYGCMADGEEMPRLSLESCLIPDPINLTAARLRRLCLKGSRLYLVLANQSLISGQLDIRDVSSIYAISGEEKHRGDNNHGVCRFALRGAHIADGIDARNAKLAADKKRNNFVKYQTRARYALDLPESKIGGDLRLFPDFTAFGGVNINGAHIQGSVQLHGAQLTDGEMYAFEATNAQIAGRIALDTRMEKDGQDSVRFRAIGEIRLINTQVNGQLNLAGAHIQGWINAELVKVSGHVLMSAYPGTKNHSPEVIPFECFGPSEPPEEDSQVRRPMPVSVNLNGAKIGGSLNCRGGQFTGEFKANSCDIGVNAEFGPFQHPKSDDPRCRTRFNSFGPIRLNGCHIRGDLDFSGARLGSGIQARGINVGGYAMFRLVEEFENYRFECGQENIELNDGNFAFDLDFSGAHIDTAIVAPNIQVGGKLKMKSAAGSGPKAETRKFYAHDRINLSGARIASDFELTGAQLRRGLRFRGGHVNSALLIDIEGGERIKVLINDEVRTVDSSIDLTNAHANVVWDFDSAGNLRYGNNFVLHLEGFTYGRFHNEDDVESVVQADTQIASTSKARRSRPKKAKAPRKWQAWLKMQYSRTDRRDKRDFNPDPYNTLFNVMKKTGNLDQADKVLKAKIDQSLKANPLFYIPVWKVGRVFIADFPIWIFGRLFKYGLGPGRATCSYVAYLLLLSAFLSYANGGEVFQKFGNADIQAQRAVDTAAEKMAILGHARSHTPHILVLRPDALNAGLTAGHPILDTLPTTDAKNTVRIDDVPCGNRAKPLLFAMEMAIPGLDLNQRAVCAFSKNSGLFWGTFNMLGTLLGWIMTSLTVLTWSGVLRRQIESNN